MSEIPVHHSLDGIDLSSSELCNGCPIHLACKDINLTLDLTTLAGEPITDYSITRIFVSCQTVAIGKIKTAAEIHWVQNLADDTSDTVPVSGTQPADFDAIFDCPIIKVENT